jgi:hypothetical protein
MGTWVYILAGIPACYYGGIFWAELLRRALCVAFLLIGGVARLVGLSADWLAKELGA